MLYYITCKASHLEIGERSSNKQVLFLTCCVGLDKSYRAAARSDYVGMPTGENKCAVS